MKPADPTPTVKHTPGPWVWRGKSGTLHRVGTDGYEFGATVLAPEYEYDSGLDTRVGEADATLIAASPDMLAALKWARTCVSFPSDCHKAIVAAIEMAEGITNA